MSPSVWLRLAIWMAALFMCSASTLVAQQAGASQDPLWDLEYLRNRRKRQAMGTGNKEPVASAPLSVSVIEKDEFEQLGVRYFSDTLRFVPGMEVVRLTSTDSNVSARGFNDASSASQGILALVDGRLAYNEFYGNVLWDALTVSLDEIESTGVVRGPGSFLYGPNALHGVVSIKTLGPLQYEKEFVSLTTRLGTYESVVSSLVYVHRPSDKKSGFKTTIEYDDIDQFDGGSDENTRDKVFGEGRYAYELGTDQVIEITGGVSEQKIDLVLPVLQGLPSAVLANDVEEAFVKANYTHGDFSAQLFWTGFDSTSEASQIYQDFSVGLDTVDLDLQSLVDIWSDHKTTVGSGGRFATFDTTSNTATGDVSDGRHDTTLVWGFFQDEFDLGEVHVTAGVRVDFHSVAGTNLSPRLAAVWEFDEEQFVRASAGTGFRNPSLRELWFNMPLVGPPFTIVGNDDLEAESVRAFELGYASGFGGLHPDLRGSATIFYNFLDDRIVFGINAANEIIPENVNEEETFGFEVEGEYLIKDTHSVIANYSFTEQRNRDTDEINQMNPRHKANLGLRSYSPGDLQWMVWVNYSDDTEFDALAGEDGKVDDYFLVNGSVSRPFTWGDSSGRVFIEAFNLLDNDHKEHPDGQSYGLILQAGVSITF